MRKLIFALAGIMLGMTQVSFAFGAAAFPLRNGDFSAYQGWARPANWGPVSQSGKYEFTMEPTPTQTINPGSVAVIKAIESGSAYFYQDIHLMKGTYTFRVEVNVSVGAKAQVVVSGKDVVVSDTEGWQKVTIEFTAGESDSVYLFSLAGGTVKFRDARIDIKELVSSAVPLSDGKTLGCVILPDNPSPAEEFAAYELQRYISKITGHVIGLKGRDKVFPGQAIKLGDAAGAEVLKKIKNLPPDSYLISHDQKQVVLAGNTPRGTLYAVYDFLKSQGCGWYLPGPLGEVVPPKNALEIPGLERIESPDYDVRGFLIYTQQFFPDGGWIFLDINDYLEWAARNRINALWYGGAETIDFGPQLGYGHSQTVNHSWRKFLLDDHPEWWVLFQGKRTKLHFSGRPNQLCVSNKELRDFVVKTVIQYFKDNPGASAYSLSPEDEPCYQCECPFCRALDADEGKGKWVVDGDGQTEMAMTDRNLNFVNEVAARIAKVYPDKFIEMYIYASFRKPPVREKVHPNVLLKYTYWAGSPLNRPILDKSIEYNAQVMATLDGWQKAGAKHFGLYDYGNYHHVETPNLRFFNAADSLRTFHEKWGFRHYLPESANNIPVSLMMYNLRAQLLWDTKVKYRDVIKNICGNFYGPAGEIMTEYYLFLDDVLMKSEQWKKPGYQMDDMPEYNMETMRKGQEILEKAWQKVQGDKTLEARMAIARFGHAYMTFTIAQMAEEDLTYDDQQLARQAHKLANQLCREYDIKLLLTGVAPLKTMYLRPFIKDTLWEMPLTWKFKTDAQNKGLVEKWYVSGPDQTWESISTDKDWTTQGHNYHGVAWYAVTIDIPRELQGKFKADPKNLALYFGAVDGYADFFLNGMKIGEQKEDVGFMWDKSFTIPLPDDFDPAVSNKLVIRVVKDLYAAGVWRPVSIVSLRDKPLKEAALSGTEIHSSANAASDPNKNESNATTGWKIWGAQYGAFDSTSADSPSVGSYQFHLKGSNGLSPYYTFKTIVGQAYKISYNVKVLSGNCIATVFTDNTNDPLSSPIVTSGEEKAIYFTATTAETHFGFRLAILGAGVAEAYADNISIREIREK